MKEAQDMLLAAEQMGDQLTISLPGELTRLNQWVVWNFEPDPNGKKPRKVPYYVSSGRRRNGTQGEPEDRAQLSLFSDAIQALERGGYDGIGIAMMPEAGLVGIDLDNCFDSTGKIKPNLEPLIRDTYAEKSPSGNGIRAFYLGTYDDRKQHDSGVEVFCEKGFLTVTGNRINTNGIAPLPGSVRTKLDAIFGEHKAQTTRNEILKSAENTDPVFQRLVERDLVRKNFGGGKIGIECPFAYEHTTGSGDADCVYYLPHTNGFEKGNFICLHAHCAERSQAEFLRAIGVKDTPKGGDAVCLVRAADIKPEPIAWIWPGYIARGKVHMLGGTAGHGKTTLVLAMGATITSGGRWPDGTQAESGDIAIWSGEDDPADTIVPRLIACGADLRRVHIIQGVIENGARRSFDPSTDMPKLRKAIADKPVRMLIVDPIVSAVSGDSHKNAEVRRSLQPLVDLAAEMDIAVYGITHFTKGTAGRDPIERITGSLAFGALTRIVTVAMKMPDDGDHPQGARLFARAKSNIGPDGGGFYYFLDVCEVPGHPGIFNTRVRWGAGVEGTAKELIAKAETLTPDDYKTGEAVDWLKEALSDGARGAKELIAEARENGISRTTLQRAKDRLKVKSSKVGFSGGWGWSLPTHRSPEDSAKIPIQPGTESSVKKHTQHIDIFEDSAKVPPPWNLEGLESSKIPRYSAEDSTPRNLRGGPINSNGYGGFSGEDSVSHGVESSQTFGIFQDEVEI